MLGVRPSPPPSRSLYSRLPSSFSPSPASLCTACSELPGTDRVVVFLVVVVLIWLGGIAVYLQSAQLQGLRPHSHAMVNSVQLSTAIATTTTTISSTDTVEADTHTSVGSVDTPVQVRVVKFDDSAPTSAAGEPASWAALPYAAILVMTYNRPTYLQRALERVVNASGFSHFHLYVSQDGDHPDLAPLLAPFAAEHNLTYIHRMPRTPLLSPGQGGTAYLAQHYKWAFDQLFNERGHSHVVVIEDDMLVSPDFFILFRDTAPLLASDPTLFCISSWHDNGRRGLVYDPYRLFRTSYFPGLGWMLRKEMWAELSPVFPLDQWDHFVRLDTSTKGRDCLVPEISRNKNIGEQGTNMGNSFFSRHLEPIAWEQKGVQSFNRGSDGLEHLRGERYDDVLRRQMEQADVLGDIDVAEVKEKVRQLRDRKDGSVGRSIVTFRKETWRALCDIFSLLDTERARHTGVITVRISPETRAVSELQLSDFPSFDVAVAGHDMSHWLYMIDVRRMNFSRLLPSWLPASSPHHRLVWQPPASLQLLTSGEGETCDTACAARSMRCDREYFSLANECSALTRAFGCPRGCQGGVSGLDVPNYVSNTGKPEMTGYCLTSEEVPECGAKHWSARRLCPCT